MKIGLRPKESDYNLKMHEKRRSTGVVGEIAAMLNVKLCILVVVVRPSQVKSS
jgi:hypothetical protein